MWTCKDAEKSHEKTFQNVFFEKVMIFLIDNIIKKEN